MINRIIFAAGGTGGHIYPAIAIADELVKMNSKIEIKFIGAKGRIEERLIPANGYKLETIEVSGFKRSLNIKNISSALKIFKALKDSKKILKEFSPELVYGTGGFVSGPVLKAAQSMGIKNVIEEGNYHPGVTVKLVAPKADKVILNFEGTRKLLKRNDNTVVMSYPVRENMKRTGKAEAAAVFGLDGNRNILLIFGGSQGAHSINSAMLKCFKNITGSGIQLIWQTGNEDHDLVNSSVSSNRNVKVLRYIDNMAAAYSASDLALCRSGISTIMELASFGLPAIFVPYPLASENHQEKNARAVAEKNAAEIILDRDLNQKLESSVLRLLNDENKLKYMSSNISSMADTKAASKIANMLVEMVNSSKN
ncbi:MAG TPA: undecaprenyldiphospho-muramoylpentapeptide beta-N-acetylglucosaminyltransferase [Ignavibacteria bacterium]|mgnify:CR=1 FL=1|nr:undecaprenyldiphospho-muramoylpentapeptide beta-N-acetylglucosaminyltransferase [Ignavibacteria bacterium]